MRGLKTSTIIIHMCAAIEAGADVDIKRLGLPSSIQKQITDTIHGPKINNGQSFTFKTTLF